MGEEPMPPRLECRQICHANQNGCRHVFLILGPAPQECPVGRQAAMLCSWIVFCVQGAALPDCAVQLCCS